MTSSLARSCFLGQPRKRAGEQLELDTRGLQLCGQGYEFGGVAGQAFEFGRPPPPQDQLSDSKINWRLRGEFRLRETPDPTTRLRVRSDTAMQLLALQCAGEHVSPNTHVDAESTRQRIEPSLQLDIPSPRSLARSGRLQPQPSTIVGTAEP